MAAVARGHGGDCGGDPPGGGNWQPPSGSCGSGGIKKPWNVFSSLISLLVFLICSLEFVGRKKGRGEARNVELRKVWKKNGKRPLPIVFDDSRVNETWKAVGDNAEYFKSLIGTLVREIPYRYSRWDRVPADLKMPIWPSIEVSLKVFLYFVNLLKIYNKLTFSYNSQMYFDMRPHYAGPHNAQIRLGIDRLCAERYRDQKYKFKEKWFEQRGGVMQAEQLRQSPPPNMEPAEWSLYMDYFCGEKVVQRSQVNTEIRAQQVHQSLHGRKAYSQYRYQNVSRVIYWLTFSVCLIVIKYIFVSLICL